MLVLVAMVIAAAMKVMNLLTAAMVAAGLLIAAKTLTLEEAFHAIKGAWHADVERGGCTRARLHARMRVCL